MSWHTDWFPLSGEAVFDHRQQHVAAVTRMPCTIDLFVIGFDNRVWTTFWTEGGGWNPDWFPLPGHAVFDHEAQRVVALSRMPGQLDLFVIGFDNHIWTTFWTEGAGWNDDWFPVPGQAVFDRQRQHLAAVARTPGQLDLFVIGFDNHVWTTFWNEGGWNQDWFPVPGQAVFDRERQRVAAVSRAPGQLDLFVLGFDDHAWTTFWTAIDAGAGDFVLEPAARGGTPARAFASHKTRASAIARHFALRHPLVLAERAASEDNTIELIAHLHAATDDPAFAVPGQPPSLTLAPASLRLLNPGHGQVGTSYDQGLLGRRDGDYDMALKGLMVIAYRYRRLLADGDIDFILDRLVPEYLEGPNDPSRETYFFLTEEIAETENHMLMINSTRYLVNQLKHDRNPIARYDNVGNGLTRWLLGYLQPMAQHDFLEFNARPYQRLSLHALFNLHEFARDESIRTAAQLVLAYVMVKYAISSSRQRRVNPFRRLKENLNTPGKLNDLVREGLGGDPSTGFFLTYVGMTDAAGQPIDRFPDGWGIEAVIAALAAYRPPPAAYILALERDLTPFQHRFYHGARRRLPATEDDPDGGVEIYYRSPSFMLTAGGMFLNSGYGHDEFTGYDQVSVAQSTTLIPTCADGGFADLVRFDPYPDERRATNTGVHLGFACGANLRPSDKKTFSDASTRGPRVAPHRCGLFLAWKGSGNDQLNVGGVQVASGMGLDGIEGIRGKVTLGDATDAAPAIASHACRLFLAWKGSDNVNLNLMFSDDGAAYRGKVTFDEISDFGPALASHAGHLFLAWTGEGDGNVNVARVRLKGQTPAAFGIDRLEAKLVLDETSEEGPALALHGGRLFIAWKGSGNDDINLAFSSDSGASFGGKCTFAERTSHAPALASHSGRLYIAWTGTDDHLNVARVTLVANIEGGFAIEGLEAKIVLEDTSAESPTLTSYAGRLFLGWKGSGNDDLNLRSSRDGSFRSGPWYFSDQSAIGFYLAAYRTPPALPDQLDTPLDNLGLIYAMEAAGGGWNADWFPVPGQAVLNHLKQHVTAVSRRPGQLDLFVIGFDNLVWTTFWSEAGGWSADWFPVPGHAVFDRDKQHVAAVSRHPGQLDLFVIGFDNHVWTTFWNEGSGWNADWFPVPGQAVFDREVQHVAAVSRHAAHLDLFVIGFDDKIWTTFWTEPMTFERFRRETLERNVALPTNLDYGRHYVFNAPDGRQFAFWLHPSLSKYTVRIVDTADPHPVDDFTALPLIEGPYLRSPNGHDGLIEVRSPDCDAPLVLDFRDVDHPVRIEPLRFCPQPLIERAKALLDIARELIAAGRLNASQTALADRIEIYEQLAAVSIAIDTARTSRPPSSWLWPLWALTSA